MDITRAYMEQFRTHTTYITLPSGEKLPKTTIQPGLAVHSRLFLRADNAPEFYIALSDPIPQDAALLVLSDGRAVFVPIQDIEDAGLHQELPSVGTAFFSTYSFIDNAPGVRMALTQPVPKGKLLMASSTGRAVMVDLPEECPSVTVGEPEEKGCLLACIVADPQTKEVFVSVPPQPVSPIFSS